MTDRKMTPPPLKTGVPALLPLEWLHVDPEITCRWRGKTEPGLVKLIAQAFKAGADVEPAKVAMLNGRWTLIDGLHRYEAFAQTAVDGEEFPVVSMGEAKSAPEARWWASRVNWAARKNLSRQELREAFRRYVQAGQHRKGVRRNGNPKSYREMAQELPGAKHTTLRDWMIADFPAVAASMSKEPESTKAMGGLRDWREIKVERQAAKLRDQLIALGSTEETREAAMRAAQGAVAKLAGTAPRATPKGYYGYDFT